MSHQQRFLFLNPASAHNVFRGWRCFFAKYFDFFFVSHDDPSNAKVCIDTSDFTNHIFLECKRLIRLGKNFIAIYNKRNLDIRKTDIVLSGDIFTNTLCYTQRKGKRIFYSEFFDYKKSFWKRVFFRLIGLLFFYNKKFILPTTLAYTTFSKISSRCFYLPILYKGDLVQPIDRQDGVVKFIFVGRISNAYKNINFMIDNYLLLRQKYKNVSLTLIGELFDEGFYARYQKALDEGLLTYLGPKPNDVVGDICREHDVFILASDSDPIGIVVLEAMARGCAMLVSDTCGSSCCVENAKNGYVFETNNANDFLAKMEELVIHHNKLLVYRKYSVSLMHDKYFCDNKTLLDTYHTKLHDFINS